MSNETRNSVDEKYLDLQLQLIDTKLETITAVLNSSVEAFRKILDDHENRLRESAKTHSENAKEMTALTISQKELEQDIKTTRLELMKRIEGIEKDRREESKKTVNMWQMIALEVIKYVTLGGGVGGVMALIFRLTGTL